MAKIGIIGGSGLEKLNILKNTIETEISTIYGNPSSSIFNGEYYGHQLFIMSRHGRLHTIPPTQVNNRANIRALKQLGCDFIIATTACGSLREEVRRGDLVILDQFIDFTYHRISTFHETFEPGILGHAAMPDPFSEKLRTLLIAAATELKLNFHPKGTVITIEGPRFSTRAESRMFCLWGADVINMSIAPEAALANEAGIPYAAVALSTDYDSWKHDEVFVTWEDVLKVFNENVKNVTNLLIKMIQKVPQE